MKKNERPLLTIQETAALLAVSPRTIYRYISTGKLKSFRIAGEKMIRIGLHPYGWTDGVSAAQLAGNGGLF